MEDQLGNAKKQQTSMDTITTKLQDLQAISIDLRRKAWEISLAPPKEQPESTVTDAPEYASGKITSWLAESLGVLRQARDALNEFI